MRARTSHREPSDRFSAGPSWTWTSFASCCSQAGPMRPVVATQRPRRPRRRHPGRRHPPLPPQAGRLNVDFAYPEDAASPPRCVRNRRGDRAASAPKGEGKLDSPRFARSAKPRLKAVSYAFCQLRTRSKSTVCSSESLELGSPGSVAGLGMDASSRKRVPPSAISNFPGRVSRRPAICRGERVHGQAR